MCGRCESGRYTDRATLLARRTAREYQRARDTNRARWAVAILGLLTLLIVGAVNRADAECDTYSEPSEPERCARDHWAN
jgi:hypothetical protein